MEPSTRDFAPSIPSPAPLTEIAVHRRDADLFHLKSSPAASCNSFKTSRKEKHMPKQQADTRVLSRLGARVITEEELKTVHGAFNTALCTFDFKTCASDG